MSIFIAKQNGFDHIPLKEMLDKGVYIRVQNHTKEVLKGGKLVASYPSWYDSPVSFEERCTFFHPIIKSALFDIIKILEFDHPFLQEQDIKIEKLKEKLASDTKIFLYTLALLYNISSLSQKSAILNSLQLYRDLDYSDSTDFILRYL